MVLPKFNRDMKREEVYKAVDSERDYQDIRWAGSKSSGNKSDTPDAMERTIDEYALYIAAYSAKLTLACTNGLDKNEQLAIFRKITALGVCCGEEHGMPKREI